MYPCTHKNHNTTAPTLSSSTHTLLQITKVRLHFKTQALPDRSRRNQENVPLIANQMAGGSFTSKSITKTENRHSFHNNKINTARYIIMQHITRAAEKLTSYKYMPQI